MSEIVKDSPHAIARTGDAPEVLNVSSEEMELVTAELGFQTISHSVAKNMAKLGIGLDSLGRVKVNNGMLYLTHQAMLKAVSMIQKRMDVPELTLDELETLTKALGYISEKLAKSVKVSNESTETSTIAVAEGKLRRASFAPASLVQYNYYGTEGEKKVEPKQDVG